MKTFPDFQALMNCHPENKDNFSALIRLMNQNIVVPFLGAGFSVNFGYPAWGEFLQKQAENYSLQDVNKALDKNEFETAASELERYLGGTMEYVLVRTFGNHVYKSTPGSSELEILPQLFRNLILTTNFDEVIEMLYAKVNGEYIGKLTPQSSKDVKLSYKRITNGDPTLIKLHGDVATREFVLTEQQYNEVYGKHLDMTLPLPALLRDMLIFKTILFLGCSLEYDRTLRVIEQAQMGGSRSFAFLELPKETANAEKPWSPKLFEQKDGESVKKDELRKREEFLRSHNIFPIWFPYKQYDALKMFLQEISHQVNWVPSTPTVYNTLFAAIEEGEQLEKANEITQAFRSYTNAAETIKRNSDVLTIVDQLDVLKKIKTFYARYGYIFESMEIIKKILTITEQTYSGTSVQMAECYHDIGYTYERFLYYDLMLKAMQKSYDILKKYKETDGLPKDIADFFAYLYTSLGYSYLKNNDTENAKAWYQNAKKLLDDYSAILSVAAKAFIHNGLYRYYMMVDDSKKAIDTLDYALKLRIELNNDKSKPSAINPQHLVNSYSNKIGVYLKNQQYREAEKEYQACVNQNINMSHDARRRIKTDYGDILRGR